MAGLARLLVARGWRVDGCDRVPGFLARWLKRYGVRVIPGHDPAHLTPSPDLVIFSAAVAPEHPERQAARARGISSAVRGEVLAALISDRPSVAVCGTHGKTTTSGFLTQILRHSGWDPSWCIGGEVPALGGVAGVGQGEWIVVEADESDGTLACYRPCWTVITNIEPDHLDHFGSLKAIETCFRQVAEATRCGVIAMTDDPRVRRVCSGLPRVCTFGLSSQADVRADAIREGPGGIDFRLRWPHRNLCESVRLAVPGRHNIVNALGAIAVAIEMGVPWGAVRSTLDRLQLPRRRFERVVADPAFTAISDYAHHPTEIAMLVRTARHLPYRRLLAVFQPHRYTRTRALGDQFPEAFRGVDHLVLVPVYAASESPTEGGTVWDLYAHFRSASARRVPETVVAETLEQAWSYLRDLLQPGDVLLIVGAGDVDRLAAWIRHDYRRVKASPALFAGHAASKPIALAAILPDSSVRLREPMDRHTTLRVGGVADLWVDVGSRRDLVRLLRWCRRQGLPLRILGAGSNTLVSDCGLRGVVARLKGSEFHRILESKSGEILVGAGLPLPRLLKWLTRRGWSGLEFLEGIPGTVGGAVRMNAGAWGTEIGSRVAWVRILDSRGRESVRSRHALDFGYRACPALEDTLVLEAAFRLDSASADDVEERRRLVARKREDGWRRRSAGSVFRNPPGDWAGRLLESVGLKGRTIGGACFSTQHANVIVTRPGARASDVRALMEIGRNVVEHRCGIRLEPEVVVWS